MKRVTERGDSEDIAFIVIMAVLLITLVIYSIGYNNWHQQPCSSYGNTPITELPSRCLKESK